MKAAVIGAGGWGTTLAQLLAQRGHAVTLWARREETARTIQQERENRTYLPGISLHSGISVTHTIEELSESHLVVFALPSQETRTVASSIASTIRSADSVYVSASKGIEKGTLCRMTEVLAQSLEVDSRQTLTLSGPSHAEEVAREIPTAVVVAGEDHALAKEVQQAFLLPFFRVYSSPDVIGTELAGALKNVIAICAGIIDGVGYGDNTKAALITRGLTEMRRLGLALGAEEYTFAGLAGLGDLVVTCESRHSRNRFVGDQIGKGKKLKEILSEMKMIAEGVWSTESARQLAREHRIEMPIVEETYRILFDEKDPRQATLDLMTRDAKSERW